MSPRRVLVTGATGNQGGSVLRALLADGHEVRALTRSTEGEKADTLRELGALPVAGSFDDVESVRQAMRGADAVFANTSSFAAGPAAEVPHGHALIDAAVAAGVEHFVLSSVGSADRATGVGHFDSKYAIEQHLRTTSLNWTITAPVFFADNAMFPWNVGDIAQGRFRQAIGAGTKLQVVSVRDIGRFNALVIARGAEFYGKRIDYAGDELTGPQMADALTAATGAQVEFDEQPVAEMAAMGEDMVAMYTWFESTGYVADIEGLRRDYPEVGWERFGDWAARQDWTAALSQIKAAS